MNNRKLTEAEAKYVCEQAMRAPLFRAANGQWMVVLDRCDIALGKDIYRVLKKVDRDYGPDIVAKYAWHLS